MIAYSRYEFDARVRRAAETLIDRGHNIDLLCLGGPHTSAPEETESLRVTRLSVMRNRNSLSRSMMQYCRFFSWTCVVITLRHLRRNYDIVYVHNMPNSLVFCALVPKLGGVKVLVDVHDPAPELLVAVKGSSVSSWLVRAARAEERLSMWFANAVITVNEPMRQRLHNSVPAKTPVAVVMNVPDPKTFKSVVPVDNGRSEPWLVYCGTISRRHGVDLVVPALAIIANEFPTVRLRIIGSGPALKSIAAQAEALGVVEQVELLGEARLKDVPSLISGALGGLSLQRQDAFGSLVFSMKVAEYISLGLPVICSRLTTMRHYFDEDELIFFEPDDVKDLARAIRELLLDTIGADQRLARSRKKLSQFDWSVQQHALAQAVESLMS